MFRRVAVVEESDTFASVVGIGALHGELMQTVESKWAMLQGAYYNFINERVFLVASFAANERQPQYHWHALHAFSITCAIKFRFFSVFFVAFIVAAASRWKRQRANDEQNDGNK